MKNYDVIVVGSGPNGLSAAIAMAQAGWSVLVLEAAENFGGGTRSEALTRKGFLHDVCSAVHPLAAASPFFKSLELDKHGLEWLHSPSVAAHPFENGDVVMLERDLVETSKNLGEDGDRYFSFMSSLVANSEDLFSEIFQPMLHWPKDPLLLTRFGLAALLPAATLGRRVFKGTKGRALFAGVAAHVNAPLEELGTAAVALALHISAHAEGWPFPKGGSQQIANALVSKLQSLGGDVQTGTRVNSLNDLPPSRWVFYDLTPRQILNICGDKLSKRLQKDFQKYRYGPGVFKMDWALSEPIPWKNKKCLQAATVHLGGRFEEILNSEYGNEIGLVTEHPFVLLTQPSLFDSTRAPEGLHTAWAYCHGPHNFDGDRQEAIENQIERYAPGFRDCVLERHVFFPQDLEDKNANLIGGDISGGAISLRQLLFRPRFGANPYRLSIPGHYICSSSTPPGPGVHGMSGFNAAIFALAEKSTI